MVDFSLKGRLAAVTGGESGIGAGCVVALAQAGADVAIFFFEDEASAKANAALVEKEGCRAAVVQVDVSDEQSVERAFDRVRDKLGMPDILVNSAGRNMSGVKVEDMSSEQWRTVIDTDLTGTFYTSRRFIRDRKGGHGLATIINITSIHAQVMRAGGADYDAAKGGQLNLTKTLALEVAEYGITVNAIAPGMILTAMNKKALDDPAVREKRAQAIPLKRPGEPHDVAGVAVFLASPAGSYITGSTVTIDGGLSLELGQGA